MNLSGEQLKEIGQAQVTAKSGEWSSKAFLFMLEFIKQCNNDDLEFDSDMLKIYLHGIKKISQPHHGNVYGALFRYAAEADLIEKTGRHVKSIMPSNRGREICVWRAK